MTTSNTAFVDIAIAKEHQTTLERDAFMEAILGARLFFQYAHGTSAPPAVAKRTYERWSQLYARDRWRSVAWATRIDPDDEVTRIGQAMSVDGLA